MSGKKKSSGNIVVPNTTLIDNKSDSGGTVINGIKLSSKRHIKDKNNLNLDEPDAGKIITVTANDGKTGQTIELNYSNIKVVGNGSFGVVFQAKIHPDGDSAAVKKVLQDKRFKVPRLTLHKLTSEKYRIANFK